MKNIALPGANPILLKYIYFISHKSKIINELYAKNILS